MKIIFAGLLAACALNAAAATAKPAQPVISNAWISEAPPTAKNNAAYLTVKNGERKDTLLAIRTPVAEAAEMHEMSMVNGLMHMQRLSLVNLAPQEELTFAPGGYHIMLINMKRPLKVGDKVPLTLQFRRAGILTVQAEVRPLDADADHSHH